MEVSIIMEGTMRAWFMTEPGKMEMREVPIPKIGPKDILFKVSYAARICTPLITACPSSTIPSPWDMSSPAMW